jgi:hypothetical protein
MRATTETDLWDRDPTHLDLYKFVYGASIALKVSETCYLFTY